jgi:hypothetical protein
VRRVPQNKSPRSDAIIVHGTTRLSGNVPATAGVVLESYAMDPINMGGRAASFAALFQRYRIKSVTAKVGSGNATSTSGNYILGFTDDAESASLTASQVINLRTHTNQVPMFRSSSLKYTPLDPQKWYYTSAAIDTGGDARLVTQAVLFIISDISNSLLATSSDLSLDVTWIYEFEGATITAI